MDTLRVLILPFVLLLLLFSCQNQQTKEKQTTKEEIEIIVKQIDISVMNIYGLHNSMSEYLSKNTEKLAYLTKEHNLKFAHKEKIETINKDSISLACESFRKIDYGGGISEEDFLIFQIYDKTDSFEVKMFKPENGELKPFANPGHFSYQDNRLLFPSSENIKIDNIINTCVLLSYK